VKKILKISMKEKRKIWMKMNINEEECIEMKMNENSENISKWQNSRKWKIMKWEAWNIKCKPWISEKIMAAWRKSIRKRENLNNHERKSEKIKMA